MADTKRFPLRLDPCLFEALRRWADDELRSINAQIEYLLTDHARRAGRLPHRRSEPQPPSAEAAVEAAVEEDAQRARKRRRARATANAPRGRE